MTFLARIYDALLPVNQRWSALLGRPSGPGWIAGTDLRSAAVGPLNDLLLRTGEQLGTADRKTIAAMFALRFGGAAGMAIAPCVRFGCVPDVALENISLRFNEHARLERTAIHDSRGSVVAEHPGSRPALLRLLRERLMLQADPVVEAVHAWSGFSRRGTWGLIASSWAEQFVSVGAHTTDQTNILPALETFFAGNDAVSTMRPTFNPTSHMGVTHLCQRRSSCCRYYLIPGKSLCASCPLFPSDQRLARDRERIEQYARRLHASL